MQPGFSHNTQAFVAVLIVACITASVFIYIVENVGGAEVEEVRQEIQRVPKEPAEKSQRPPILPEPGDVLLPASPTVPDRLTRPARFKVDLLLIRYEGDHWLAAQAYASAGISRLRGGFDCSRIVSYPDTYVPVIISKRRMAEVQRLLGDEVLPLTEGLEWPRNE